MARRGRSSRTRKGIFSRLYSPVSHLLMAGEESVGAVTNTARGVVGQGLRGLNRVGKSVTGHANGAIRDLIKGRKSRRANRKGGKRNTRKTNRKNRRNTRRNDRK